MLRTPEPVPRDDAANVEVVGVGAVQLCVQLLLRPAWNNAGMRIRFWPKTGSGALHFKLREIFKSRLN